MVRGMNPREYSTRAGSAPAEDRIADVLAGAAHVGAGGQGRLLAPAAIESWPGIVHGGGLVALIDGVARAIGGPAGPRTVESRLTASVPSETALALEARADGGVVALTVAHHGQPLASGLVSPGSGALPPDPWRGSPAGLALPTSERCLACGTDNRVGLGVTLSFDDEGVWARLTAPARWRDAGGRAHPALAPVLLDEVAWWLGALTMREGGLTNRIAVSWREPAGGAGLLVAAGRFRDVTPIDRKGRFWRTAPVLLTGDGAVLATASIVFRGGPEYSARQLEYFRARTPADVFARMFPGRGR